MLSGGLVDYLAWRIVSGGPLPAMRLTARGVQHSKGFAGTYDISVPWDRIIGSGFKPGLGHRPVFCLDAVAGDWPVPRPEDSAPGEDGMAGVARALTWVAEVEPEAPKPRRNLLVDVFMFGTPLAVDLAECRDVEVAVLDQALKVWTDGRCRCAGL